LQRDGVSASGDVRGDVTIISLYRPRRIFVLQGSENFLTKILLLLHQPFT
jgi:hypothetical protein